MTIIDKTIIFLFMIRTVVSIFEPHRHIGTHQDLGRPGPDYDFGWGRVDAAKALKIIENGQYWDAPIHHNETHDHFITVPAGVKELKMMVYWHDPAGAAYADQALVNDLDIRLTSPNGQQYQPWVLST